MADNINDADETDDVTPDTTDDTTDNTDDMPRAESTDTDDPTPETGPDIEELKQVIADQAAEIETLRNRIAELTGEGNEETDAADDDETPDDLAPTDYNTDAASRRAYLATL